MNQEEFNKVEKLVITDDVWVAGKPKKVGDEVSVKGNDKVQLLASGKAKRKETKKADK